MFSLIYTTHASLAEAESLLTVLLNQRLIACANVIPPVQSYYRWQGRIEVSSEVVALLKTTPDKVSDVLQRFKTLSSYETPCAFEIKVGQTLPDYLAWLQTSLQSD